ncbi:hypothetical protein [Bosea sp. CS1GBMeth4]|uniref:hypothetical protein n=1 Tax=Bosea sp. CS1GBMeth4 TaxID=1892849 RepID=UPI0016494C60|nr:hypothetical protein [Bosea sp. CS1GBMeth4]
MTLANMRAQGVRYVSLFCGIPCSHHADICADALPADMPVPEIGQHYRCSKCGRKGVISRPAWHRRE